ncbi:MAG: C40 family peptidase [Ignavibacteriales bacterium]|nr:C40 family peptidase [Ignavibacteriales bacterium]
MKRLRSLLYLLLLSSSALFAFQERPDDRVRDALKSVKDKFAPDRRTAVFDVSIEKHAFAIVAKGDVDNAAAKEEVLRALHSALTGDLVDSIQVLPDPRLGEKLFGIVILSVGNVRGKPGNAEELATQVLMGMAIKLLKKEGGYYYVQSSDQYLGWLDDDAIHAASRAEVDAWAAAPKVIATGLFSMVREKPDANALPVCDVVVGGMLKKTGGVGSWVGVELADGRKGFVEQTMVEDYESWKASRKLNGETVERSAKMMMGVPYLWGGTSVKGMDCSGFTKTVFRMNGMELNRDANQQALMGEDLPVGEDFQNLRKGDLLFFGRKPAGGRPERITHVAIYLDNKDFIHSSGRVRYGSFNPASPYYDEFNLKRFVRARRLIPTTQMPEVRKNN